MNWYLETPSHWIRCEVLSNTLGLVVVRLYDEQGTRSGRARKGLFGLLVEPK